MVQPISLGCKEDARQVKHPAGQERVDSGVRTQPGYGSATHRRGYTDQVAKTDGELDVLHAASGKCLSLDYRHGRGARAVSHGRPFPEHDCCKKLIVVCRVSIDRDGGFMAGIVALSGEWRANDLGGYMPEQDEVYKVDCLDLREAWHKHNRFNAWCRSYNAV